VIQIKSGREIEIMAEGGRILGATVAMLEREVRPGMSTADLDALAEDFIRSHDGAVPAFKGLYGFPGSVCTSINNEIVHGIPSRKRVLREGDIVSIDVGVGYRGYFTDSAVTVPVGRVDPEAERLLSVTRSSLAAGIAAARPGAHIGDIGAAVQAVVEGAGFSVVRDLVGHGIGVEFHEEPQVPNYGKPKRGVKLVPGLTLAIEPMVNAGGPATRTLPDKWTIVTVDGSRSAHFEHTIAITENGPRVLTQAA
jgi:methionyl aminopeptidase